MPMHNCLTIEYYKSIYISFDFKVIFYKILILIVYWGKIDLMYYKWLSCTQRISNFFLKWSPIIETLQECWNEAILWSRHQTK